MEYESILVAFEDNDYSPEAISTAVRLAALLPEDDTRRPYLEAGIEAHARASIGAVTGSDYMVEHWLASYALLYLSGG